MNSRSTLMVSLLAVSIASSATSTSAGSAVDLANYFPVNKREIKFVIASVQSPSSSTGFVANVTIQECDSTATASFTNVLAYDGSTVTFTNTDGVSALSEKYGVVTKRYVRALYNSGQATSGSNFALAVAAFPLVRAA
jgi:hypothetical protein